MNTIESAGSNQTGCRLTCGFLMASKFDFRTSMEAFDKLDLDRKIHMVESAGDLIMQITHFQYYIGLYTLDKQLVEVYFDSTNKTFVNILSASFVELDKYVKHIDISDLTR